MGFFGWFVLQAIYTSFAAYTMSVPLAIASLPINIVAILGINKLKLSWIAYGVCAALVVNFIGLVMMGLFGVIDDEAIIAICIIFPPFILLFTNWLEWLQ